MASSHVNGKFTEFVCLLGANSNPMISDVLCKSPTFKDFDMVSLHLFTKLILRMYLHGFYKTFVDFAILICIEEP